MKPRSDYQSEILPWYRRPSYRGKMPERHKQLLDRVRMSGVHPAKTYADLPDEVQRYITRLELQIYNTQQQSLTLGSIISCSAGLYLLYQWYRAGELYSLFFGLFFALAPWIYYPIRSKRNWEEFSPHNDPNRTTNEAMQEEWDIHYSPDDHWGDAI